MAEKKRIKLSDIDEQTGLQLSAIGVVYGKNADLHPLVKSCSDEIRLTAPDTIGLIGVKTIVYKKSMKQAEKQFRKRIDIDTYATMICEDPDGQFYLGIVRKENN